MTREGDVVLVHMDNKPAFFARIEEITTDVKAGWYHVKLLVLQVPLLVVTWILREAYYNGQEFTMGGHPMRIETVVAPQEEGPEADPAETKRASAKPELVEPKKEGKVISMLDRLKKGSEE
ncbi:MAG: hypothetical protein AB9866_18345 [Syntrophobacteraceae bacterium]